MQIKFFHCTKFFQLLLILIVLVLLSILLPHSTKQTQQYAAGTAYIPVGQTGNWNMIFDDEFQGTTLDSTKWNTCYANGHIGNGCQHGELEVYLPNEVVVNNGLTLRAEKKTVQEGGSTFNYTSGMISTGPNGSSPAKFTFKYGYMEMHAKVPSSKGTWPAFWTLPADGSWPPEIDAFEILGNQTNIINMHYHYPPSGDSGGSWTAPYDTSSDYHVYGLDWEPNAITWYIDGVQRRQYTNTATITSKPMYILANLAIGGSWPGSPDTSTIFPSNFQISYIRVWQKGKGTGQISPTLTPSATITTSQSNTLLNLTICPHDLGNCGDNANPNNGGNTQPLHTSRQVTVTILDGTNKLITQTQGALTYSPSAQNFQGTVTVPDIPKGNYIILAKMDGFLGKQFPGIFSPSANQQVTLPVVSLTAGDINNDNQLDILDYNILISCYGSKMNTSFCTDAPTQQSSGADLNDDGLINGADYNLLLRELSIQKGSS